MNKSNIVFEHNNFICKVINFDLKKNVLSFNKYDKENNFIKKDELKMGQIPKKIKKLLNPLKISK